MLVLGAGMMLFFLDISYGFLLLPLLVPFFNFASVPLLRLVGYYKYLNPYVISTVQTDEDYDLHNVFTFDYFVNFKWSDRGAYARRILLGHYFLALLTIIDRIENQQLSPHVKITGDSYFFNDRTAEKLGFTTSKASAFWVFNSVIQFLELTFLYSFSKGKWAVPKFWKVKRAEITGRDLVEKKDILNKLVRKTLPNHH